MSLAHSSKNNTSVLLALERGYTVDRDGTARDPSGRAMGGGVRPGVYQKITLTAGMASKADYLRVPVHRMQAYLKFGEAAFAPAVVVRHLNGNTSDNSWDNIAIGTMHDNMMDQPAEQRLRKARTAARARQVMTDQQVLEARRLRADGTPLKDLCTRYGVQKSVLSPIVNGKMYRHLPMPETQP